MGEEATHLENEIRQERAGLADSIQALEQKAHRASNWRYQYAKRPALGIGLAFVGGLALARLATNGRSNSRDDYGDEESSPRRGRANGFRKSGLLAGLQGAVVSILATELKSYLRNRVLNTNDSAATASGPAVSRGTDASPET